MLNGISPLLSPELLKVLCEMGHNDCIVLGDSNFAAESVGKHHIVIRSDGHTIVDLLEQILKLCPLDEFIDQPVTLMEVTDKKADVSIRERYYQIIEKYDKRGKAAVQERERFDFYDKAKEAYAVVATGEQAPYANIILQKGVVTGVH